MAPGWQEAEAQVLQQATSHLPLHNLSAHLPLLAGPRVVQELEQEALG